MTAIVTASPGTASDAAAAPSDGVGGQPRRAAKGAVVSSEFIYEAAPFPSCHASTIAETPTAALVAAWFGGTHERHPDVGIWVAPRVGRQVVDAGRSRQRRRRPTARGMPCWNPVLFQPQGRAAAAVLQGRPQPADVVGHADDVGRRRQDVVEAERLPDGILGPIKNKPVQLADGVAAVPVEHRARRRRRRGWRRALRADARTSARRGRKVGPLERRQADRRDPAERPRSTPAAGCRRSAGTRQGRMFETWSADGGKTWSPMTLTDLPNPNSGTDAVTLTRRPAPARLQPQRRAQGPHAAERRGLDRRQGVAGRARCSRTRAAASTRYPAVIQTADGLVHVTYTWKRRADQARRDRPGEARPTREIVTACGRRSRVVGKAGG